MVIGDIYRRFSRYTYYVARGSSTSHQTGGPTKVKTSKLWYSLKIPPLCKITVSYFLRLRGSLVVEVEKNLHPTGTGTDYILG